MTEITGDRFRRGKRASTPSVQELDHHARLSQTHRRRESNLSEHDSFIVDPLVESWGEHAGSFSSEAHRTLTTSGPQLLDSAYLGMLTAEPQQDTQMFNYHSGLDAYSVPSPGHQYEYLGTGVHMSDRPNLPWFSAPASPTPQPSEYFSHIARMQDADYAHGVPHPDFTDVYHQADLEGTPHLGDPSRHPGSTLSATSRGRKRSSGSRRGGFEGDFATMDIERDLNQDDTEKKHRGRPRLDNRDETAAERRRTQIRLAQRAYRQRKETTIASLKNRVEELETTLETMLNTFFEIHDSAIDQKIVESHPQFGQTLRGATEKILALSKEIGTSAGGGDEGGEHDVDEHSRESGKQRVDIEGSEESFFASQSGKPQAVSLSRSRSTGSRESQGSASGNLSLTAGSDTFNLARIRASIPSRVHSPAAHQSLILPPHEERTFAQRLRRLALEWRYYRLVNGNPDVTRENQPANFCLLFASKEETLESLRLLLSGRDREPYQLSKFPIAHLGGSGLHYRVDRNVNGTIREIRVGNREQDLATKTPENLKMILINRGFGDKVDEVIPVIIRLEDEGLLDPDEVEAILALRGIRLTTTSASPTSPILVSRSEQRYQLQDPYHGGHSDLSPAYGLPPVVVPSQSDEVGMDSAYRTPARSSYQDFSYSKEVKVDILLRELVLRGVCTGLGTAFRRVDVEAALSLAASA